MAVEAHFELMSCGLVARQKRATWCSKTNRCTSGL